MAILGIQIAATMIMASVLSKFSSHFSFGRWILCCGLTRYLHPSDEELRKLAGPSVPNKGRGGKKNGPAKKSADEPIMLPKTVPVQLEMAPIKPVDLLPLHFYTEYQWLMDFCICGLFIYCATELYYALFHPVNELNLSMLWCTVMLGFTLRVMFSITSIYFRTEEGGERMLCVMFGFFFLVLAMAVLIVDEEMLEFGLLPAYQNFSTSAVRFLEGQGFESAGPVSLLTVRIVLAIFCALLGAFFTFPGLRLAKMHTDALKYTSGRPFLQLLLHINLITPLLISLLWVRPLFREYLVKREINGRVLLSDDTFDIARLGIIFVFCIFRFCLTWQHLQAHLNMAYDKVANLKKEAGRISSTELKKLVVRVYYYLCVVALQYLTPVVMLLFSLMMLKTFGEYSITRTLFGFDFPTLRSPIQPSAEQATSATPVASSDGSTENESIFATASHFSLLFTTLRQVFTPLCFRGLLSFFCWWICTVWFTTSAFGVVYYTYFDV